MANENISAQIKEGRKVMTRKEYRNWLQKKLDEHGIDRTRLMAVVIVVERALSFELSRSGSSRYRPYYKLWKDNGVPTRAWVHAAELALWLKYNGYKANPFMQAISRHPIVRKFIVNKERKKQIPLNVFFPSGRVEIDRLRDYSRHFRSWDAKH